jgi:hypothetical protein
MKFHNSFTTARWNRRISLGIIAPLLIACGSTPPTQDVETIMTSAAETVDAEFSLLLTQTAQAGIDATEHPTATEVLPTGTSEPAPEDEPTTIPVFIPEPEVAYRTVRLTLPKSLANGINAQDMLAPNWGKPHPEYSAIIKFELVGYPSKNVHHQPSIYICPVDELGEYSAENVLELMQLLVNRPPGPKGFTPWLPDIHAGKLLESRFKYLDFKNGSGIRVLTQYAQNTWPINNEGLVYVFQGMTNDRSYYISAFLPASVPFLPDKVDDSGTVPPVNGITFPEWGSLYFETEWGNYRDAVTQKLNATSAQEFTPDLELLDSLIQSLHVGTP